MSQSGAPQSPAGLLDPGRQVVDFLGRPEELEALVAWCEDDDASSLRLVTGPGGVGKTRLAVEVSRQLAAVGWICEGVGDGQEARAVEALRAAARSRTLLVVDYAEARSGISELLLRVIRAISWFLLTRIWLAWL